MARRYPELMRRSWMVALVVGGALGAPGAAHAIVGGQPATRDYPGMAELDLNGEFQCGASLVRQDWMMTAAHCVQGAAAENLRFVLGRPVRSATGGETIPAAEVVIHEEWEGNGYDIALVRLANASSRPTATIVSAAQRDLWSAGRTATVIGWGATSFLGEQSDELREVQVPIQSDNNCTVSYPLDFDPATMMCAGYLFGGRDSCSGDSGGPLLVPDGAGRMLIAGIVSFGTGCAIPTQYGIYTRVGDAELSGWLARKLPPVNATPGPPPVTTPAPGAATPVKLRFSRSLGSARKAVRTRRLRITVISSGPVFSVRASLVRTSRGKTVTLARGTLRRLTGEGTLKLKVLSRLKRGTLRLKLTARDAQGKPVKASGRARLSR